MSLDIAIDDDKVDRSIRSVGMSFYSFHQVTLPQGFVIVRAGKCSAALTTLYAVFA